VIMVDDLELGTLDAMLENDLMPNLQEFVIDRGMEFTNSFVTTPLCCPSRSTFLTGQYSHNHGVLQNQDSLKLDDSHTLATWLHDSGYRTGLVGKYLNDYGSKIPPTYVPPGWDSWVAILKPMSHVYNYTLNDDGILIEYGVSPSDYKTDVLAKYASDFINESETIDDEIPFFLEITPTVPHDDTSGEKCSVFEIINFHIVKGPMRYQGTASNVQIDRSPSFNETDVSDIFLPGILYEMSINDKDVACLDQIYQNRMEAMRAVDDLIKVVINALDKNDEFDNTVIVFTSDNGFLFGEHRLFFKELVFEEAVRVPLFISTPEYHKSQSSSKLVINNDLAPTILDLAGATADISMDGRSLIPLLSNPNQKDWRDKFLIELLPNSYQAIRTDSHVYVSCIKPPFPMVCYLFYDLISDPYQLNNLYPCIDTICTEQITALDKLLLELKDCREGTCQTIEDKK